MYNDFTNESVTPKNKKGKYKIRGIAIKTGGRTIGQAIGDTCHKDVSGKKHFIHHPEEAIAFNIDALHAARQAGAEYVQILDTDTGITYRTSITKYFEFGERFDFGYGPQLKLSLPNFTQARPPIETQTIAPEYAYPNSTHDQEPKELKIKSRAPTGITYIKGHKTLKQLSMFGEHAGKTAGL